MTHTPHWIDLAGAHNVRDLAGLPAVDGRRIRSGVLLRGDHLDAVTEADLAVLRDEVGLRAIVDLRTPMEAPAPAAWVGGLGLSRLHLPLIDLTGTTVPAATKARFGEDPGAVYRRMLDEAAPNLVRILEFVVADGHAPCLVHCAAGKDRTGITVAVLLAAAGVDEPGIVADYVATGERLERVRAALAQRPLYRELSKGSSRALRVAPVGIQALLEVVQAHEGGAAGWLTAHGAAPGLVAAWRDLLLEPSSTDDGL